MFTGPVGPVEVFCYGPEAIFWYFLLAWGQRFTGSIKPCIVFKKMIFNCFVLFFSKSLILFNYVICRNNCALISVDPPPFKDGVRINSPHYLVKMVEEPGTQTYTLVVSQYEKNNTIRYTLRVYASCPFSLSKISEPYNPQYEKAVSWFCCGLVRVSFTSFFPFFLLFFLFFFFSFSFFPLFFPFFFFFFFSFFFFFFFTLRVYASCPFSLSKITEPYKYDKAVCCLNLFIYFLLEIGSIHTKF